MIPALNGSFLLQHFECGNAFKLRNGTVFNPLSPNVADLQHFDIELFCGFSLYNTFCPSAEFLTVGLLVLPLSLALVIKAG